MLHRTRQGARLVGDVPLAVVRRRAVAQQQCEDLDELAEPLRALVRFEHGLTEHVGVPPRHGTGADTGDDPAVTDPVERDQLLGEHHGVAEVG